MGWTHDTGHDPAYDHEGYPLSVLDDGTEVGYWSAEIGRRVTGWRAGCECGWRGGRFYSRTEWPSPDGGAPEEVDGYDTEAGTYAEWTRHLAEAVPTLAVHDAAERAATARDELNRAVALARAAGASWAAIGAAAGMSKQSAHERWAEA